MGAAELEGVLPVQEDDHSKLTEWLKELKVPKIKVPKVNKVKRRMRFHPHMLAHEMASRYYALMSPAKAAKLHVVLVGCGAIGSNAAVALAKIGVKRFTLWDMDIVEPANVGVQAYDTRHIGVDKTLALADVLKHITADAATVTLHNKRFTPKTKLPKSADVVVAALDNVETREMVWAATTALSPHHVKPVLYVDPRMGAEQLDIKATVLNAEGRGFTAADRTVYEGSFHKGVPPAPCGANSTPYTTMICGAMVAARVKQFCAEEPISTWAVMHVPTMNVLKGADNAGFTASDRSASSKHVAARAHAGAHHAHRRQSAKSRRAR